MRYIPRKKFVSDAKAAKQIVRTIKSGGSAGIIPVPGAKAVDCAEYGGLLGKAVVMDAGLSGRERLISRGGRIHAPLQGVRN